MKSPGTPPVKLSEAEQENLEETWNWGNPNGIWPER